ncbi:NAD(P)-binding domain-containing protein [Alicyclobacillus curvatus]|nr:NAD(P)-binding domain-containing protein [Alicyclobacillus curvatus]
MRIGIIGTGNIGGMLSKAFATARPEAQIIIHNRSRGKANQVAAGLANVDVASSPMEAAQGSDTIFLCTKSTDGWSVLDEVAPRLTRSQTLVTTISSIPMSEIEQITDASVAKVIPSILQSVQSGVILVTYGARMSQNARERLTQLLSSIAHPQAVSESQVRIYSDLSSCGPAFISEMLVHWADAAANTGNITTEDAQSMLVDTVIGLAHLFESGKSLGEVITHVAVPGGVTETGILSLRQSAPQVFEQLHQATQHHGIRNQVSIMPSNATKADFVE